MVSPKGNGQNTIPMEKDVLGYWHLLIEHIKPDTQYLFELDGELSRPDPASNFQPHGVHDPSQVIDHHSYNWTDKNWRGVPLEDFINDLKISKSFMTGKLGHNFTAGYFYSYDDQRSTWWWHNVLSEIKAEPRALDLMDGNSGIYLTHNGYSKYGSQYLNYQLTNSVNAIYADDEISFDKFTLDVGIRYEMGDIFGWTENTEQYDMGDPTTMADDAELFGNGTYEPWKFSYDEVAYSIGLNYAFNNNIAFFGRVSNGYRAPDDNNLVFDNATNARVEDISQYEAGVKYASPNLAFFLTGFYSLFSHFPFSDEVVDPTGRIIDQTRYADSYTIGGELEAIGKYKGFQVKLTGTFQVPTYKDYIYTDRMGTADPSDDVTYDFDGNQVRRIPKIYGTLSPSYTYKDFWIGAAAQFFGERYTDDANSPDAVLPSFLQLNAGVSYRWDYVTFEVNGTNLTNVIGLTEGNPRTESVIAGQKAFRMARPIMGRTFVFSVGVDL